MKNLFASMVTAVCLAAFTVVPASAAEIADVSGNYWASAEIVDVVSHNIMGLDANYNFNPEDKVSRICFVKSLLKVLSNENLNVSIQNQFSDVTADDANYDNILRSQQLGLVYGYPDGTFKASKLMTRAETQSVISHITKDKVSDTSVLAAFADYEAIPAWATQVYAKTLEYGIYVNYPNAEELRPNDILTRAEAAVLLAKLRAKLDLVKTEYKGEGIEHLAVKKNAPNNEVYIMENANVIKEGNVLEVAFTDAFKSELAATGDSVYFVAEEPIYTEEGTLIIPAGSKFCGTVIGIEKEKWFNKNARVYVQISEIVTPDGKSSDINAKPFYKNYELKEGPWMTAGKLLLYSATGAAIGTGAGVGLSFIPDPDKVGTGIAIGAPVGAGLGLITGLVTPGLKYHAKAGEDIYVILLDDAAVSKQ